MINEWHLVLHNIGRRKFRTTLTTLAIVFGVAVIFAVGLLMPGLRRLLEGGGRPAGTSDLRVESAAGGAFDPELAQTVAGIRGVQAAAGILQREIRLAAMDEAGGVAEMIGVDYGDLMKVSTISLRQGRLPRPEETGVVVLPSGLADSAGIGVGDVLPLPTVDGLREFAVAGVFDDRGLSLTPALYLNLADVQEAFALPGRINAVEVRLSPAADRETVAQEIRQELGSGYRIGGPSAADVEFVGVMFNLFGALALFVGGFLIFNTFRTVVAERRREIGMLRALGADRPQILRLLLMESGLQGIIGTALGLLAGYPFGLLLARGVSAAALRGNEIYLALTPAGILLPVALGIGTTLAAGYFPARSASAIPPLAALQPPAPETERPSLPKGILGLVLAASGLALVLAGEGTAAYGSLAVLVGAVLVTPLLIAPTARILTPLLRAVFPDVEAVALSNVVRQPGRTAVTVNTLMVGAAVLVATNAMMATERESLMHTFEVTLAGDSSTFTIMPGAAEAGPSTYADLAGVFGAGSDLAAEVAGLPGVQSVVTVRAAQALCGDSIIPLIGIDPESFPSVRRYGFEETEGDDPFGALRSGRAVFINGYMQDHLQLGLGDDLTLQTPQGTRIYRVAAVLDDYTSGTGAPYAVVSQDNLARDFGVTEDGQFLIQLVPAADPEEIRGALETVLRRYPQLRLVDSAAYQLAIRDSFNSGLVVFDVLMIAVLLPSLLGLLNTLAINVLERTTEIGLLRAVGTDRTMVRRMILAESLVLVLLGAATGLAVGAALSGTFISVLQEITPGNQTVFPLPVILAYLAVFLALALSISVIPARGAARLNIVQALQSE
jgi:putative ABC transport system permease protein